MKNKDIPLQEDKTKDVLTVSEDDKDRPRYEITPTGDSLRSRMELTNIAEKLSEHDLHKIGKECLQGYQFDCTSREHWERDLDEWMRLATQVREAKNYPWPRSSNVKYPLLTTAAMQFAARAYPSLVPADGGVVKSQVIGKDPDGSKLELATRIDTFMSYQVMFEMKGWEEDMDKLLIMLPVVGTAFKKTYWDPVCKQNVSKLVLPKNLVVNYWTECLETSERISEVIMMSPRIFEERKRAGVFCNVKLAPPVTPLEKTPANAGTAAFMPAANDVTTPYTIVEQHTYLDLDNDGYREPYIVTFDATDGCVLRITARYDDSTMHFNAQDELLKIEPIHYYTKFGFIPNPDGSFYDIGFGQLLGPINETVNTLINQLTDAGTLSTLQSGFLGKGLRLKMGEQRFMPGEWKPVNATGDDLKKQIVPLPAKEPSPVLFQLMGSMITSGKELASVAEIFTGKMPGQNTPATTTMATVEQGMKVFTAVYKRLYRSLDCEFRKLFALNGVYLNPNTYQENTGLEVSPDDFKMTHVYRVIPGADPTASSTSDKLMKAHGLMELMPLGTLDPIEVTRRNLDAMEQPNPDKLLSQAIQQTGQMPPPPPDPKLQEIQMTSQLKQQELAQKGQMQQSTLALKQQDQQTQQAMAQQQAAQNQQNETAMTATKIAGEQHHQAIRSAQEQAAMVQSQLANHQELVHTQHAHNQQMVHNAEMHKAKVAQQAKAKQQGTAKK